jgi:hypothetical protein
MSTFDQVKTIGDKMPARNPLDIFTHFESEVEELRDEIIADLQGNDPGEDGIAGEIVDAIACLMDLYQVAYPDATSQDFDELMQTKLEKWQRLYS